MQDGSILMDARALKTEPEDLSVREERGFVRLPGNRQINLEAGAQAIQVLTLVTLFKGSDLKS